MKSAFLKAAATAGIAMATVAIPSTAQAAHVVCTPAQLANAVGATGCYYVVGNANSNSAAHRTLQQAAINALSPSSYVYNYGTQADNSFLDGTGATSLGTSVGFGTDLFGETIIGLHFGNGVGTPWRPTNQSPSNQGGVTAFYLFDFATPVSSITLNNATALSNGHLYTTNTPAVPEPGTWLMLLLGFFGMGGVLRRDKAKAKADVSVSYS